MPRIFQEDWAVPQLSTTITAVTLASGGAWIAGTYGYYQDLDLGVEYDLSTTWITSDLKGMELPWEGLGYTIYNSGGTTYLRYWSAVNTQGDFDINVRIIEGMKYTQYVHGKSAIHSGNFHKLTVTSVPDWNSSSLFIEFGNTGSKSGYWDTANANNYLNVGGYMLNSTTAVWERNNTSLGSMSLMIGIIK